MLARYARVCSDRLARLSSASLGWDVGPGLRSDRALCQIYFSHVSTNTRCASQRCIVNRPRNGAKTSIFIVRNCKVGHRAGHSASHPPPKKNRASSRTNAANVVDGVVRMAVLEATCGPENRAPTLGGKQINAFHVCCKHMLVLMEN